MEIAAQSESRGIIYEGYTDAFKQCVFEDGAIQGRNERYEFRCDANLECCGRTCCIPQDATVPLWLVILFIILGLLLLMALAALLAYLYSKRKPKPKKVYRPNLQSGYKTIRHVDDDANKEYSALDESAANTGTANGYGNRAYERAADLALNNQNRRFRRRGSDSDEDLFRSGRAVAVGGPLVAGAGAGGPRRGSWHEHETFEEEFKEEIEYERGAASDSSEERLHRIP
uniref:CX domain-containing protein n=1 Tax=Panagrolaimus sp. JU765 TaxID=591449 RepID=A0AC34QTF7_9BILA